MRKAISEDAFRSGLWLIQLRLWEYSFSLWDYFAQQQDIFSKVLPSDCQVHSVAAQQQLLRQLRELLQPHDWLQAPRGGAQGGREADWRASGGGGTGFKATIFVFFVLWHHRKFAKNNEKEVFELVMPCYLGQAQNKSLVSTFHKQLYWILENQAAMKL